MDLLGAIGGDEDPIPPDGALHPLPNAPFGGIWEDADFDNHHMQHDPVFDANGVPMILTPPQSPGMAHGAPLPMTNLLLRLLTVLLLCKTLCIS